jgi:hypothetical protein
MVARQDALEYESQTDSLRWRLVAEPTATMRREYGGSATNTLGGAPLSSREVWALCQLLRSKQRLRRAREHRVPLAS